MEVKIMKNNLWVFGDSFSAPFDNLILNNWLKLYLETAKLDKFPFWQEIVAEKLNLNLIDNGVGGSDNYSIFESFCKNSINIKSEDCVIINWSNINRFRIPINDTDFFSILPKLIPSNLLNKIIFTEEELNKISISRNHKLFQNEINNWSLFINEFCKLKNVKILFWGICEQQPYFFVDLWKYMNNRGTIKDDFPQLNNYHFSKIGHELFANIVIEKLEPIVYNNVIKFIKF
jgi:hypothetical protein